MRKKFLFLFIWAVVFPTATNAQIFYSENFDGVVCPGVTGCDHTLVGWTQTITGPEGTTPNKFYISCAENGNVAGLCGTGCGSDQSLHVGNIPGSPASIFCPAGDCGASYDASAGCETNRRVESPVINCAGFTGITISFVYMENGEGALDDAALWYFDGTSWSIIDALAKTSLACAPQGTWTAFSLALPASADLNPNVRIGFGWINNGNNAGSDPSFAIDDVTLTATPVVPVAGFTFTPTTPCTGQTVTFTNTSTGTGALTYAWTFAGGTPATSTATNPTATFATAGPHTVTLIVTDGVGNDDTIVQTVNVITCIPVVADFSYSPATVCAGSPVTFTNTGSGAPYTSASWNFPGAVPATSASLVSATITWATPGTYLVTFTLNNASSTDTYSELVTVIDCNAPPVAGFTPSANPLCQGQCIDFTNTTISGVGSFTSAWTFTGATPATSTLNNPTNICFGGAGTYPVTLIVTDANGSDTITTNIIVNPCTIAPVANFTYSDTICQNQCIGFTDASSGIPTSWSWVFAGASTPTSSLQNPTAICYPTIGTFTVVLTVTNSAGSNTVSKNITVVNCSPPGTSFLTNDTSVCLYNCVQVNNTTTFGTNYIWLAPFATPDTSFAAEPGQFCYNDTTGTFLITLIAYNAFGSDTAFQFITVDTVPIVEAFPDEISLTLGDSVDLSVVANCGLGNLIWVTTDTASIDDNTLSTVNVTPTTPTQTIYYVYVYGPNGCANVDSVIINVELTDVIALPDIFSPNGDGYNDVLRVLGPGVKEMNLMIYNRYGQLVFSSTKQENGWDGKHKGKQLDPGVFGWYLEYTLNNGFKGKQKGNVTLVR
jgi:gliding motility-associated-like protein